MGLRSAVPSELKELIHSTNTESFILYIDGKKYDLKYCKVNQFIVLLYSQKQKHRGALKS